MSRVSPEFGRMIKSFLESKGLTFRAAAFGSSISAAYWKDMSDGRVPSEDVIAQISRSYDEFDENELRSAAGYAPRIEGLELTDAISLVMRSNKTLPEEGKQQIIDFAREIQKRYAKKGS